MSSQQNRLEQNRLEQNRLEQNRLEQNRLEQNQPDQQATSVWHYKPWWCQPWSIALTGISLIGGSWILFHRLWLTCLVALPIGVWMVFFLVIYPRLMLQSGLLTDEGSPTPQDGAAETGK